MTGNMSLSKRHEILKSASVVVNREGVANLTLAAVAKEAGISKGGLLYHFPSKDSLIQAMVTELMDHLTERLQQRVEQDPNPNGRWSRAYAQEVFTCFGELVEANAGLLAAISTNRDMLEPVQQRYFLWKENMEEDGIDPIYSMIIRLAADGLKFNALFGMPTLQGDQRKNVLQALIQLTSGHEEEKL